MGRKIHPNKHIEEQLIGVNMEGVNMKHYNFILIISGITEPSEGVEDGLFEAGCDDATLSFRHRLCYLEFDRVASSFKDAVISAIQQVESVNSNLVVERVEPDDLVTASQIAHRIGKTREYVRLLIEGKRGAGNFPIPITGIYNKSLMWSWTKVSKWLMKSSLLDTESVQIAQDIADINNALFYRGDAVAMTRINELNKRLVATL